MDLTDQQNNSMGELKGNEEFIEALAAAIKNIRKCMQKNKKSGGFTETSLNNFKSGNAKAFGIIRDHFKTSEFDRDTWIETILDASQTCGNFNLGLEGIIIAKEALNFDINLSDRHKKLTKIAVEEKPKDNTKSEESGSDDEYYWDIKQRKTTESISYKAPALKIETLKNRSQNVTNWFRQFEIHTRGWKDEIRGLEVAKYFEGIALQKYELMTENEVEYGYVKKHMIDQLQSSDFSSDILTEFFNAKQRPDENIDQYGHRLLEYVKDAPIEDREIMEHKLAAVFKKGCTLEVQKLITTSTRTSFNDLWEDARKIEKIVAKTETVLVEPIKETVDAIKKPLKCYNCKKEGHIAKECRAPRMNSRKQCSLCGLSNHDSTECQLAKLLNRTLQQICQQQQYFITYFLLII